MDKKDVKIFSVREVEDLLYKILSPTAKFMFQAKVGQHMIRVIKEKNLENQPFPEEFYEEAVRKAFSESQFFDHNDVVNICKEMMENLHYEFCANNVFLESKIKAIIDNTPFPLVLEISTDLKFSKYERLHDKAQLSKIEIDDKIWNHKHGLYRFDAIDKVKGTFTARSVNNDILEIKEASDINIFDGRWYLVEIDKK